MKCPNVNTVDYETKKIENRPAYPPVPVGAAYKILGGRSKYLAWGHPTENNCTKAEATRILEQVYAERPVLFYNKKFDLDVGEKHLGLKNPRYGSHDAMFLAFLHDPNAKRLDLKHLADVWLSIPPDEQTILRDWIFANIPEARRSKTKWGAWISETPGKLVGKYAGGDTDRTHVLFKWLWPLVINQGGMWEAYEREQKLCPILLDCERRGVPIAEQKLRIDYVLWQRSLAKVDAWICKTLKTPDLNIDSADELADGIEKVGFVDEWFVTKTGKRSTAKDNIRACITNAPLIQVLEYRSSINYSIKNFARPWLDMSNGAGKIWCQWNQVKQTSTFGTRSGARTGRLSSSPNLMNIPNEPPVVVFDRTAHRKAIAAGFEKVVLMPAALCSVVALPWMRDYIKAPRGQTFNNRDYNQQEFRILGHYEAGSLMQGYIDDPTLDVHDYNGDEVHAITGVRHKRKPIKTTGFGLLYGMGYALLAEKGGVDIDTAKRIKNAILQALPGVAALNKELKFWGRTGTPLVTWGGRVNYCEDPRIVDGRKRSFEYKMLNTLIQGSAADCTKQAVINYAERAKDSRLVLQVHDELKIMCPTGAAKEEMLILKEAMEAVEFDVPMLTDGKTGPQWSTMKATRD